MPSRQVSLSKNLKEFSENTDRFISDEVIWPYKKIKVNMEKNSAFAFAINSLMKE